MPILPARPNAFRANSTRANADTAPSLQQQTIRVRTVAVTAARARWRTFPAQNMEPTVTVAGTQTWGGFRRAVGPAPPQLIGPLPTLQQQTVRLVMVAVRSRSELARRAPHSLLVEVIAAGLPPPVVVRLAGRTRAEQPRRFPLQGWTSTPFPAAPDLYKRATLALLWRTLGPHPPLKVAPLATERMRTLQTIEVDGRTRRETQRLGAYSRLQPPAVVLPVPALRDRTTQVTLAAVQTRVGLVCRPARSRLGTPSLPPVAPIHTELVVEFVRASMVERRPRSQLRPPVVVAPAAAPTRRQQTLVVLTQATETRLARPTPRSRLAVPATTPPPPTQDQQTVTVTLTAVAARRRWQPGRVTLSKPTVVVPLPGQRAQTVTVTLAGRTRTETQRRAPMYTLAGPQAVLPLPSLRAQTITIRLASLYRQAIRPGRARLPLVVVAPPGPPVQVRLVAVAVRLLQLKRRAVSTLAPPQATLPSGALLKVTLAGRTRQSLRQRRPMWRLAPPIFKLPTHLPAGEDILGVHYTVAVNGRAQLERRKPHHRLRPPTRIRPIQHPVFTLGPVRLRWHGGPVSARPAAGWTAGTVELRWRAGPARTRWQTGTVRLGWHATDKED